MRIACIYLPSFPLQAHIRRAPHLAGAPVAVTDGAASGARVVVCSRAAWADGIRPGMAATTARSIAPHLTMVAADPELYEQTLHALGESLLCCAEAIELGATGDADHSYRPPHSPPHRAVYLRVPPRARGNAFGQKLLTQISRQGFRGRVGVADDRFTARVAAVRIEHRGRPARLDAPEQQPPLFQQSCTSVPRGGSAAFLAPLPLTHLSIDPDVRHLLETCGVRTLGDFAALPPPSVSRAWIDAEHDFQKLARGQGPALIRPSDLDAIAARPLGERLHLRYEIGEQQPLAFAMRKLCDHVSYRLAGRQRVATALTLRLFGPAGETSLLDAELARPTMSSTELLSAVLDVLEARGMHHAAVEVELEVTDVRQPDGARMDLFSQIPTQTGAVANMATPASAGLRPTASPARPHIPARRIKRTRRRPARAQQSLSLFD